MPVRVVTVVEAVASLVTMAEVSVLMPALPVVVVRVEALPLSALIAAECLLEALAPLRSTVVGGLLGEA